MVVGVPLRVAVDPDMVLVALTKVLCSEVTVVRWVEALPLPEAPLPVAEPVVLAEPPEVLELEDPPAAPPTAAPPAPAVWVAAGPAEVLPVPKFMKAGSAVAAVV